MQWIAGLAGIATVVGTIFAACALFRRPRNPTSQTSAAGRKSAAVQTTGSRNSPIVTNSPSAVVVGGDLNLKPGYDVNEHERILEKRVAQVRSDLERAHKAEVDALRTRINALSGPEWDKDILNAVDEALTAKRYDRAGELMAGMDQTHLADASIPAAEKLVRIRQFRAAIALVSGDAKTASEHVEAAVSVLAPLGPVDALEFRNDAAMHFQDYGERIGGDGIVEAIQMYRRNLEQLNRESLQSRGQRHNTTWEMPCCCTVCAPTSCQHSPRQLKHFRPPCKSARPQLIPRIGLRHRSVLEARCWHWDFAAAERKGKDYLAESVTVLRAAAAVRTREVDPECWAGIQSNLGAALSKQGVWCGGVEGIRLLGEAVEVYRGLLEVRARETDQSEWAGTQANLSCSLAEKARLITDAAAAGVLNDAVEAAGAALQVYSKEQYPMAWARTHNNLGAILNEQAHRQEGEAGLECVEAATVAFRCALEVYVREEFASQWAGVQRNLSVTFLREAVLKDSPDDLDAVSRAVSVCRAALEVFTREEHPLDWAAMRFNLGAALLHLGEWTGGAEGLATLEEATSAFQGAEAVYIRETHPEHWADVHRCLGHVYEAMGNIDPRHEIENYRLALREAGSALEVLPHEQRPDRFENARAMKLRVAEKLSAAGG